MAADKERLLRAEDADVEVNVEQYHQVARELQEDAQAAQLMDGTDWVMFLGTTNAILVAWTMSAYPEHMWLIFCIEGLALFVLRTRNVIKPTRMAFPGHRSQMMIRLFYMFEFCYFANYAGLGVAIALPMDPAWLTDAVARRLFAAGFGVSGSLLGATAAFRNRLLFHDVDNTVSVFIHFFPALVMYTIRWHYGKLEAAWPSLFFRGPFDDIPLSEIFLAAAVCYMIWFVPYTTWMVCCGRRLPLNHEFDTCLRLNPEKTVPHDTIFHFNMRSFPFGVMVRTVRGCSDKEWQRKCVECDFGVADVLVYMFFHACCNIFGPLFALILYTDRVVAGCAIVVVLIVCIQGGSGRYAKMIHLSAAVQKLAARRQ